MILGNYVMVHSFIKMTAKKFYSSVLTYLFNRSILANYLVTVHKLNTDFLYMEVHIFERIH